VIVYMPMIPEAVVAMLACARLGAIHSVVFGGFAANELASRIEDSGAKLVVSASCGIEGARIVAYKPLLDQALERVSAPPERCVIVQRPQLEAELRPGRDLSWAEAMDGAPAADCVPVAATDPLYILYTSGTTGMPKGIVRDNGGHAVALDWSMDAVYGVAPGEVFWAASDIGWVVGHSYIVYAPLLHGCTTVLYEGKPVGTPDAGAFWRVCADHGVDVLFTAPTAIRAIKREDSAASTSRVTTSTASGCSSWPASARPGHARLGADGAAAARDRPLVADRDRRGRSRPTPWASSCCRSSPARPASPCPATTCGSSTTAATRSRRARSARSA
jgi:propionyl-CoA synthetase